MNGSRRASPQRLSGPLPTPQVTVTFRGDGNLYTPGERLLARYRVEGVDETLVTAVERSVAWYSEGKGEEDLGVVFFDRVVAGRQVSEEQAGWQPLTGTISMRLPLCPLSYEGLIVKIRWCVRLRLFFVGGRDFVSEHIFFLGDIPVARPPEPVAS